MTTRLAKRWTPQDLDDFHKFHKDIKEDVMRRAARTDNNQHELVEALKKIGARSYYIKEPVDLLVGFRGRSIALEVKSPGKQMTQAQKEFFDTWPGEAYLCHTIEEAVNAVVNGSK